MNRCSPVPMTGARLQDAWRGVDESRVIVDSLKCQSYNRLYHSWQRRDALRLATVTINDCSQRTLNFSSYDPVGIGLDFLNTY